MQDLNRVPFVPPELRDPAADKTFFVSLDATPSHAGLWWDDSEGRMAGPPNAERNRVLREMRATEYALMHSGGQPLQPRMCRTTIPKFVSET